MYCSGAPSPGTFARTRAWDLWRCIGTGRKSLQIISWRQQAYTDWDVFCVLNDLDLQPKKAFSWPDLPSTRSVHRSIRRVRATPATVSGKATVKNRLRSLPNHHSPCAASLDLSGNDKSNMAAKQTQRSYLKKTKFFLHLTKRAVLKIKRLTKKRQLCLMPGLHWRRQTDQFRVCTLLINGKHFWIWPYLEKPKTHKNPDLILIGISIAKNHQKNHGLNQLLGWKSVFLNQSTGGNRSTKPEILKS
jgi:hypothetical protein